MEVLSRIDWNALLKSKAVWSGIATAITSIAALSGRVIDPHQLSDAISAMQAVAEGLTTILGVATIIFRSTATTQIIKPAPDAPAQTLTPKTPDTK